MKNLLYPKFALRLLFCLAVAGGVTGYLLGMREVEDYFSWMDMCRSLGVEDVRAFVRVAFIHNGAYAGGLIGLVGSLLCLGWLNKKRVAHAGRRNGRQ